MCRRRFIGNFRVSVFDISSNCFTVGHDRRFNRIFGLPGAFVQQKSFEHLVDFGIDDVQYARNHVVPLCFIVEIVAKRLCLGRVYLPLIYPVDYSFRFFGDVSDK